MMDHGLYRMMMLIRMQNEDRYGDWSGRKRCTPDGGIASLKAMEVTGTGQSSN